MQGLIGPGSMLGFWIILNRIRTWSVCVFRNIIVAALGKQRY